MDCRMDCGACCVAISISSPIPGMPEGKPSGVRCLHLTDNNLCALFGKAERPEICSAFKPSIDFCGGSRDEAVGLIYRLEVLTSPSHNG